MDYAEFLSCWDVALRDSHLRLATVRARERIDLSGSARDYSVVVQHRSSPITEPFWVTATLKWRWSALDAARSFTNERGVMVELLGRRGDTTRTRPPMLRIDVKLSATLMRGHPIAMPSAHWIRRWMGALELLEPQLPAERGRETKAGDIEILGGRGEPRFDVTATTGGALELNGVHVEAFELHALPRVKDSDERPDPHPGRALADLFDRVAKGLVIWADNVDRLQGQERRHH